MNVDGDPLSLTSSAPSIDNRGAASEVLLTFRQASSFYVTHRLCEALTVLEQLLFSANPSKDTEAGHGSQEGDAIATIPRKLRVKIWSLYITVLDATIKLGSDVAKGAVGVQRWQELTAKVRDGQIWDDVVKRGYSGNYAAVDPEVVLNLSLLLLAHSSRQASSQERLEAYLSGHGPWPPDIPAVASQVDHLSGSSTSPSKKVEDHAESTARRASTKIFELYVLHILPRNEEWKRARSCITTAEPLGDEDRDRLLRLLNSLELERDGAVAARSRVLDQETETLNGDSRKHSARHQSDRGQGPSGHAAESRSKGPGGSTSSLTRASRTTRTRGLRSAKAGQNAYTLSRAVMQPVKVMDRLRSFFLSVLGLFQGNLFISLRTLLFLIGLFVAFTRGKYQDRARRITATSWHKLKATLGMGVTVNYI